VRRPRILIVDDLDENRQLLAELLAPEGHDVEEARDGQEAVERAFADPPDLVVMDITMPRLSGLDACRLLKSDPRTRRVPIVLVTAHAARSDRLEGIAAGCDDFLTKPVDGEQLLARVRTTLALKSLFDQLEEAENVLVSLANALEAKDSYTRGHSDRVAQLAETLAAQAGLDADSVRNVRRAGLIHDIGKIGIPLDYLQKAGPLTEAEFAAVKRHPLIGHEICRPLRTLAPLLPLIRGHHERLDGSGYPDGLRGDEIPLTTRCLTVADIYDALTSERSYRPGLEAREALATLRREAQSGFWDPHVVALLERVEEGESAAP
jgi:putative two-component system response regulator